MRNLLNLFSVVLAGSFLLSTEPARCQSGIPENPTVVITVTTDKDVYKPNQPIEIRAAILNGGSEPFYVFPEAAFGYYGEGVFSPELRDENGREILEARRVGGHTGAPANANYADYVEHHWLLLRPACFYGTTEKRFIGVELNPGTYTLRVTYRNSLVPWVSQGWAAERLKASANALKYPVVTGDFVSQSATFRVVR